ncbi:type IV pilin N-terminal domain-containing protein [Methanofollis aquaemaris]|uniref:type IV pilin N-terminal domain-containing protein n=1 Tax=Methanofollis aquaemaris TaxID=126734 RepID=UPI00223EB4E3|nr:type IV pilin N-terminal domain-containing protein [Methanofollis aquaemaris]
MNSVKKLNEEAVSPVIGVILMVAITVILAATIAMFAFNSTDSIKEQKVVALKASAQDDTVVVNLNGGASVAELKSLKFMWGSNGATITDAADFQVNGVNAVWDTDGTTTIDGLYTKSGGFTTGDCFTLKKESGNLKVIGIFADGTEQVFIDKTYA